MAMTVRGSQRREPIEDTEWVFLRWAPGSDDERILRSAEDGSYELWVRRDDYAGYVLVIAGIGYEFVRDLSESEVLEMM